jgi:hypothetical protein
MTFIPFHDIIATSPSGEFRVEITGTLRDEYFRDRSKFVYRLFRSEDLVWEWQAGEAKRGIEYLDDFPHDAWVNDEGYVVARTHEWFYAGLIVFTPKGQVVLRRSYRSMPDEPNPGFLEGDRKRYVSETSAGPFWARCSIAYFHKDHGRSYWTIRTWWGRRVVIDLENASIVDAKQLDNALAREQEVARLTRDLKENLPALEKMAAQLSDEDRHEVFWPKARPVLTATYHAGRLKAIESAEYLRRLEAIDAVGSMGGRVPWATVQTSSLRQVAKLSLLRMGEEPSGLPHYQFEQRLSGRDSSKLFDLPVQVTPRALDQLEVGLTQKEVLARVGAPDFIDNDWEYDSPSPKPAHTVRITWDDLYMKKILDKDFRSYIQKNPPRIVQVEVLKPQWTRITKRDFFIAR